MGESRDKGKRSRILSQNSKSNKNTSQTTLSATSRTKEAQIVKNHTDLIRKLSSKNEKRKK